MSQECVVFGEVWRRLTLSASILISENSTMRYRNVTQYSIIALNMVQIFVFEE